MIAVVVGGLAISLAFVKINGQTMPKVILSAFFYVWSPRTYTWQRAMAQTSLDVPDFQKIEEMKREGRNKFAISVLRKSIKFQSIRNLIHENLSVREVEEDKDIIFIQTGKT